MFDEHCETHEMDEVVEKFCYCSFNWCNASNHITVSNWTSNILLINSCYFCSDNFCSLLSGADINSTYVDQWLPVLTYGWSSVDQWEPLLTSGLSSVKSLPSADILRDIHKFFIITDIVLQLVFLLQNKQIMIK